MTYRRLDYPEGMTYVQACEIVDMFPASHPEYKKAQKFLNKLYARLVEDVAKESP